MNTLETLLTPPFIAALSWALLHFLWQGTLIALLLAGVLHLGRLRTAHARYVAACAALLLMAVLPLATMIRIGLTTPDSLYVEVERKPSAKKTMSPPDEIAPAIVPLPTESRTEISWHWLSDWSERVAPLLPWIVLF